MTAESMSLGWVGLPLRYSTETEPAIIDVIRFDQFAFLMYPGKSEKDTKFDATQKLAQISQELFLLQDCSILEEKYKTNRDEIIKFLGALRFYIQVLQNAYSICEAEVLERYALTRLDEFKKIKYTEAELKLIVEGNLNK